MSYKSMGEMFLMDFLENKKKKEATKRASRSRIEKLRNEAMKMYKQTNDVAYADKVRFYDNVLDMSDKNDNNKKVA